MDFRLLIDGKLVEGASTLDIIDPATAEPFAVSPRADMAQLQQAVAAAARAFPAWAETPWEQRAVRLRQLAEAVRGRAEELATLLTREQGKPLAQARMEVLGVAAALDYFAGLALPLHTIQQNEADYIVEQRTPLGVVAAITPWNFPLMLLAIKIGPALLAGNTVVAKPAPTTPLTTLLLGELAAEIFPPGVFNVLVDLNDLGAALTSHPDIAKVAFTGSTGTGRKIMASAASTLKRLTLELGGNDAAIVLDDADLGTVGPALFQAATLNAGQVCMAAKRIYAPRSMKDALCEVLAVLAEQVVVGNGLEPQTQLGPLQNRQQYEKVVALLDETRREGRIIAGGHALDRPGYFIAPTVVRDLPDSARLVREEQFAPLLPVLAYDTLEEVLARANDSEFGLAGTVWSSDDRRGLEVALRVQAGTLWVNKHLDLRMDVPFGGTKQSGFGIEQGLEGLKEFTQMKIINVARAAT